MSRIDQHTFTDLDDFVSQDDTTSTDWQTNRARKSARLSRIPAPFVRTSLSPEAIIRAARREGPSQISDDDNGVNCQQHNHADVDQKTTADPSLPDILIRKKQAALPKGGPSNDGCWLCRLKHQKCKPYHDSCVVCLKSTVKCRGRGLPVPTNMRGRGGDKKYIQENLHSQDRKQQRSNVSLLQLSFGRSELPTGTARHRSPPLAEHDSKRSGLTSRSSRISAGYSKTRGHNGSSSLNKIRAASPIEILSSASPSRERSPPRTHLDKNLRESKGEDAKANGGRGPTIAEFLKSLHLGHKIPLFHRLQLCSAYDLKMMLENIDDPVRRQELWQLLETKGLSIIEWWKIEKALKEMTPTVLDHSSLSPVQGISSIS